jgi:YidC/Oxa1 family membrane protein insertase
MDNIRLVLWLALAAMLWFSYAAWQRDYGTRPAPPAANETPQRSAPQTEETPPPVVGVPASTGPESAGGTPAAPAAKGPVTAPVVPIHVRTDVLDVLIDKHGGNLVRVDLPRYPVHKDQPNVPVRLLDYEPDDRWVIQSGLTAAGGGAAPDHLAHFTSEQDSYELAAGQQDLVVTLDWKGPGGVTAQKVYTFHRGEYRVDLDLVLQNSTQKAWQGAGYAQMVRLNPPSKRHFADIESYSFRGPVLYDGERYKKLPVEDLVGEPVKQKVTEGWFAGIQHHFLAAAIPPADEPTTFEADAHDSTYVLKAVGPAEDVPPGGELDYRLRLFVGPKLQNQLKATAKGLELTVDYGVLTVLAQPLFWALSKVHALVHNWGWSIILVTMMIKLAFYKLTATSGRSMAKMRKIAPRMKNLQERYKDDRQGLSQAMMELYKKEKVNPAAGCLPILIQMPFFFAFYWVLIESVEMRQAPFMLWINDLSVRDPYFVLPLLMGAAMFLQSRINPAPPDPIQARVMQIMPLAFTVFFAFFPAGLVLYWLTNTSLSILQQWRINKLVAAEK